MDDSVRLAYFDAVFVDWLGGQEVYDMLIAASNGMSIRSIAEMHHLPRTTVHTWLTAARTKLRRVGLGTPTQRGGVALGSSEGRAG